MQLHVAGLAAASWIRLLREYGHGAVQIVRGGATRSSDEDSGVRDSLLEGGNADDVPDSRRKWGRAVSLALDRGGVDEHYSRYRVLLRRFFWFSCRRRRKWGPPCPWRSIAAASTSTTPGTKPFLMSFLRGGNPT